MIPKRVYCPRTFGGIWRALEDADEHFDLGLRHEVTADGMRHRRYEAMLALIDAIRRFDYGVIPASRRWVVRWSVRWVLVEVHPGPVACPEDHVAILFEDRDIATGHDVPLLRRLPGGAVALDYPRPSL